MLTQILKQRRVDSTNTLCREIYDSTCVFYQLLTGSRYLVNSIVTNYLKRIKCCHCFK